MDKSKIKNWPTLQCDSYIEPIARARKEHGVALLHLPMMQQELADGPLVKIDTESLTKKKSHYLCYQKSMTLPHNEGKLFEFLSGSK